jgi:hypothetical protein
MRDEHTYRLFFQDKHAIFLSTEKGMTFRFKKIKHDITETKANINSKFDLHPKPVQQYLCIALTAVAAVDIGEVTKQFS